MFASPLTILSEDALDAIHGQAMTILEEIGTEVVHEPAREMLARLGQKVEGTRVRFDREFVMEQLKLAPSHVTVRGRNPERAVTFGGGTLCMLPPGGSPFVADRERGRRDGMYADHVEVVKMTQATPLLRAGQSGACEAGDVPETSRHLDLDYSWIRYSDKPYVAYGTSGPRARDSVELAAISRGGRGRDRGRARDHRHRQSQQPARLGLPDGRCDVGLGGGQPAHRDDAVPARRRDGARVRGAPGSRCRSPRRSPASRSRRPSGRASAASSARSSPASTCAAAARRWACPSRCSARSPAVSSRAATGCRSAAAAGSTSANALDAQAATESAMSLWGTYLSGCDLVLHAAGWLEGGLTCSFEKLALDLEVLRMFESLRAGLDVGAEELALETIREEGPGGIFLASPHTLEHFREWVFMSPLFRSQAHPTWLKQGAAETPEVATAEWKKLLASWEDPGIDDGTEAELQEYMAAPQAGARRVSGRDPRHDVLFEPVRIGPKTLRNRFYQVPHCTGFGVEKPFTQARHRALKAEGGWASVCTEYCAINPESDEYPFVSARLWDAGDVRALRLMTEGAHEHGALAAVELWHGGIHVEARESRTVPLAPSQIASEFEPLVVPKAMELSDIRRTQDDWVAAALRAREAGFDIVYVYGSHTYLPTQFLSPRYNHRTDAYGGSFENRARFWLETLERVRAAVGDDCAIAIRIAADTLEGAGIEPEEGLAFIRAAEPLVDLFDCVVGGLAGAARLDAGASRFFGTGYQLEWTARFREATAKPIVGTGLMVDPDVMADVIESGVWDLIGAARPSIADPFLPVKIEQGRYDEIRACIGCNACYALANRGRHLGCTQNATAGEEHRRGWHPERFERAAGAEREVLVDRRRARRASSARSCSPSAASRACASSTRPTRSAAACAGSRSCPASTPGAASSSGAAARSSASPTSSSSPASRLHAADVRASGADLVVVATGAHWSLDGFNGVTQGADPRRRRDPRARAHARADHARGESPWPERASS